ncbi:MAG: Amidase, partial [Frankiales bacterium]|nr:Amidase [Frankiales bacterium]
SGYSSLGGQVLNPYDTSYTPSGSSSGSATAVALGYVVSAVGSETDGSITSPAAHQSLVGVKPTHGLISGEGILPIASSQDTVGPLARTVSDAADLLTAMSGLDIRLVDTALQGARLACVPDVPAATRQALQAAGAELVDITLPELSDHNELHVLRYEFARDVDRYLAGCQGPIRTLQDLADWNRAHPEVALKFRQVHVDAALAIDHLAERAAYEKARADDLEETTSGLERAMEGCEALVFPGAGGCSWSARAGWPSVVVPNGYGVEDRRPVGLMLVSRPWTDTRLLSLAYAFEQATHLRRDPWEINPAAFRHLRVISEAAAVRAPPR